MTVVPLHPDDKPVLFTDATVAPTQAQQIAGQRVADTAAAIGRITGSAFLTPHARDQAKALRIRCEQALAELRRSGL